MIWLFAFAVVFNLAVAGYITYDSVKLGLFWWGGWIFALIALMMALLPLLLMVSR